MPSFWESPSLVSKSWLQWLRFESYVNKGDNLSWVCNLTSLESVTYMFKPFNDQAQFLLKKGWKCLIVVDEEHTITCGGTQVHNRTQLKRRKSIKLWTILELTFANYKDTKAKGWWYGQCISLCKGARDADETIILFRSIRVFCGTVNILQKIPSIQTECEEYLA